MRILTRALLPTAAVLFAALVPGGGQPAVAAAQLQAAPTTSTATASTATATAAAAVAAGSGAAAAAYWTPQRMRGAASLDNVAPAAANSRAPQAVAPGGASGSVPPSGPAARTSSGATQFSTQAIRTPAAIGRVFFHNPKNGHNYSCSAAAVNSPSRQLVVTAAHCVHGGRGGTWMTKWVYVPAYRNGNAPYGYFSAKTFRTFQAWIKHSTAARDVAMVTTWPYHGRKLVNVTGGNGIAWNHSHTQSMYVLGYPGNYYKGEIAMYCHGTTSRERGTSRMQIRCNFGHGASGGPWLRLFNTRTGLGYVNGLTSTGSSNGWDQSPYFDTAVGQLYQAQAKAT